MTFVNILPTLPPLDIFYPRTISFSPKQKGFRSLGSLFVLARLVGIEPTANRLEGGFYVFVNVYVNW